MEKFGISMRQHLPRMQAIVEKAIALFGRALQDFTEKFNAFRDASMDMLNAAQALQQQKQKAKTAQSTIAEMGYQLMIFSKYQVWYAANMKKNQANAPRE